MRRLFVVLILALTAMVSLSVMVFEPESLMAEPALTAKPVAIPSVLNRHIEANPAPQLGPDCRQLYLPMVYGPSITPSSTPTATPIIMCTPPPCKPGEVFYCPCICPGGCGTECATPTPKA